MLCFDSRTILFPPARWGTGQRIHGSMSRNVLIGNWSVLDLGGIVLGQFLLVLVGSLLGPLDFGKDGHIGANEENVRHNRLYEW